MRPGRVGFLIPEFPQQTHIAWWRVSEGMRSAGVGIQLLSTRRPKEPCPHPELRRAAERAIYLWPPSAPDIMMLPAVVRRTRRWVRYIASLETVHGIARLRTLAFVAAAARLRRISRRHGLDHVFIHSCASAAHVGALCRILGGPPYSLRLGGDLEVYGGDHRAKMAGATLIVPAAQAYESRLVDEAGVAPERILSSWVGTDTGQFRPDPARVPVGPLRIVTVARLNPAKGYQFLLPALARLRDRGVSFRYQIVGAGPFEATIRALVAELRLDAEVDLLGSRSSDEVADLLRASDLFVLPTSGVGEGTPAAVCEAMSAGLPVIATSVGGLSEMISEGVHGCLVPPADVEALADAVGRLVLDPARRVRMGAASRARAVERYDYRAVAARILERIDRLTGAPSSRKDA